MNTKKKSEINYEELYRIEKKNNEKYKIENKYLLAQINIYNNKYNKGEKSEVLLIMKLFYLNKTI